MIRRRQTLDDVLALESLEQFRVPGSMFHVRVRGSGSWFQVQEFEVPDGGVVAPDTDVMRLKQEP